MTRAPIIRDDDVRRVLALRGDEISLTGLLDSVMAEVRTTRPRTISGRFRRLGGTPFASLAAAAAVLVAIVAVSAVLRPDGVGRPSPAVASPTAGPATLSPAPTIARMTAVGLDGPVMAGGTYATVIFHPSFRFTVQGGRWVPAQDLPRQWLIQLPLEGASGPGVNALSLVHMENVYVDPCASGTDGGTQPWTGDAAALFEWLNANSPVSFGEPAATTMFGRPALEIEVTQPELATCVLGVLPITDVGRAFTTGLPGQPTRYIAVDVDGQTLLVAAWASGASVWAEVGTAAEDVLGTVEFN